MNHREPVRILLAVLLLGLICTNLRAQNAACESSDPAQWPRAAKPYFLIIADTSASMSTAVGSADSCGYGGSREAHQRCAIDRIMKAYAGQVDFGLMTFARRQNNCTSSCFAACTYDSYPGDTPVDSGCGAEPNPAATNSSDRRGGFLRVPLRVDATEPPSADNITDLLNWTNNQCTGNVELFANGNSPLNGALRDAHRYLSDQWVAPDGSVTYASPLTSTANGERACRSVRVILLADGDESCDLAADAVDAAGDLFSGFTRQSINWQVRTHAIALDAGANLDAIAAAGGTSAASSASVGTDAQILSALNSIVAGALRGEQGDNVDNNCNGCIDEGLIKYQNIGQTCCAWGTAAQRTSCLTNFQISITPANPQGTRSLLPCTTAMQSADPSTWLTYNPGEVCDNIDNNGVDGIDEGMSRCGNPAHCPQAEICDGTDNNCNGQVDEGATCSSCLVSPSPEICDGCDNDCDGMADEGVPPAACGLASPASCQGLLVCKPSQPVPIAGACVVNGGYQQCNFNPLQEVCDSVDNNCDGAVDNGLTAVDCEIAGAPPGLVYGGSSQCRLGRQACGGECLGYVGPTPEVTDGIDNDCDGQIENGVDIMFRNGFE